MNEWLKKRVQSVKDVWAKGSIVQKIILFAILAAVVVAIVLATTVSSRSTAVRLFDAPVGESERAKILDRINRDNISAHTDADGYIFIDDKDKVRLVRETLIAEGLVPSNVEPWAEFFDRSWSTTDMEQNQRKKIAMQTALQQHIEALPDVRRAPVALALPEKGLFADDNDPVSASVILDVNPTSDLLTNRKRLMGIQKLIKSAVPGLKDENIIITDTEGAQVNDFAGMEEMDRLSLAERTQKMILKTQATYRAQILKAVEGIYTKDRIRDSLLIKIEMDTSKRTSDAKVYTPITIKEDNPNTPYDDSEFKDSLTISSQTVTREWQGTGFNPEGPAGVEGQTPPVYSDMSNVIGRETQTGVTQNNVVNEEHVISDKMPKFDRVTVALNIDGKWNFPKDPKTHDYIWDENGHIKREYVPVPKAELEDVASILEGAIGSDKSRNYSVTVRNVQIDRDKEFDEWEVGMLKTKQMKRTMLLVLAVVALILGGFVVFRVINREMERRRREREEELLRKQQAAREQALWDAKDDGMEVTMSVEESHRAELQENAIAMAKAHPEDVAMLIRTWLAEE